MSVDLTIEGPVAKIVLNRPEKLNALTHEMRAQLRDYTQQLRFDENVRCIIVTGEGRAFCTGADVGRMQRGGLRAEREKMQGGSHQFLRTLHATEKPVIAAVRGPTVGIGWSIALACDLIVASETARFSQVFRRIGLAPDGGAIWLLTRRIGLARAKELVFTARFVEAAEALSLGLVNYVVPDGELMAKAEALAADLASGPTFAFGMAKKLFHMASGPSYEDFLDYEAFVQPQLDQTEDHREGVAAFREKRTAEFRRAVAEFTSPPCGARVVRCGWGSHRIPWIHVARPLQRRKAVLHRRQPVLGQLLRRPAVGARHDADRPRLVVQIHLVAAHAEDLPRHAGRRIGTQERDELRDVVRPCPLGARLHLLLGLAGHRLDHPAERVRADAVGADVVALHVHRDAARQPGDAQLRRAVVHLPDAADQPRGGGDMHVAAALLLAEMRAPRRG